MGYDGMDEKKHTDNAPDVKAGAIETADRGGMVEESVLDLRAIRESRGQTLQDLSAATKVNPHNLKAIEEQRFDVLPEPIYARAFIDMYAKALDLDPKKILARYDQYLDTLEPGEDNYKVIKRIAGKRRRMAVWLWVVLIVGLIALAGVYSFYQWHLESRGDEETMSPAAQTEPAGKPQPGAGEPSGREKSAMEITGEISPPVSESTHPADHSVKEPAPEAHRVITEEIPPPLEVQRPAVTVEKPVVSSEQPTPEEAQKEDTAPPEKAALTVEEPYVLVVEASELTWIQISKNGAPSFEVMLKPGERITEKASERFDLLIGNAGGVDIRFQGMSLGPLGGHGQVIRLTLPPNR